MCDPGGCWKCGMTGGRRTELSLLWRREDLTAPGEGRLQGGSEMRREEMKQRQAKSSGMGQWNSDLNGRGGCVCPGGLDNKKWTNEDDDGEETGVWENRRQRQCWDGSEEGTLGLRFALRPRRTCSYRRRSLTTLCWGKQGRRSLKTRLPSVSPSVCLLSGHPGRHPTSAPTERHLA